MCVRLSAKAALKSSIVHMDWTVDEMTAVALLHQYSEWLDVENIQMHNDDGRTHDDLVQQFLSSRHEHSEPRVVV